MSKCSTRSQFSRFLLVGSSTVLIDFFVYRTLLLSMPTLFAKSIGFLSGAVYAFQLNRLWTFQAGKANFSQAIKFSLVYGANLGVNVTANATMIMLLAPVTSWCLDVAFLIATSLSAALNFVGMKWLAFAPRNR